MIDKMIKALRGRVGPVGLSLAAAALTAVAFAAVSVAKDDSGSKGAGNGDVVRPGPGGPPPIQDLSKEDQRKLEDFRQCMSDQGVEPPPGPDANGDSQGQSRPEPPSEAERAKTDKAFEACNDKLPEGAQAMGPGPGPCGPPPGANGEGAALPPPPPGTGSRNQEGSTTVPAPQGSTS